MRETDFLNTINEKLSDNSYLGDDCAYLSEFGLYVTQDTLVEDVHFSMKTISVRQLGIKSAAVNLSDLAACGAEPLYLTVSLSMPENIKTDFVEEFYEGLNSICENYNVKVIGGDLTGADKIFISICAIGKKVSEYNISRKYAKAGDAVVVTGNHGKSAAGLRLLCENKKQPEAFIKKHLEPVARIECGISAARAAARDFAMMDTSDGLGDALYKIAKASGVRLEIDFEKIPVTPDLKKTFPQQYKNLILWGGEDYELTAVIPDDMYKKLDKKQFVKIGEAKSGSDVIVKDGAEKYIIDTEMFNRKSFQHFKEQK